MLKIKTFLTHFFFIVWFLVFRVSKTIKYNFELWQNFWETWWFETELDKNPKPFILIICYCDYEAKLFLRNWLGSLGSLVWGLFHLLPIKPGEHEEPSRNHFLSTSGSQPSPPPSPEGPGGPAAPRLRGCGWRPDGAPGPRAPPPSCGTASAWETKRWEPRPVWVGRYRNTQCWN